VDTSTPVAIVSNRWTLDGWPEPPNDSVVGTPVRRPGSVRRTTHINATWPGGEGAPMLLSGRARDLLTSATGDPQVLALDELMMEIEDQRVRLLEVHPRREGTDSLIGVSSSRKFRSLVDGVLPDERSIGTPLFFMLDDVPMLSRIGGVAWSQHRPPVFPQDGEASEQLNALRERIRTGPAVCSGLRPGGYNAISFERSIAWPHYFRIAGDLGSSDPWAWHDLDPAPNVCFRRRRRVDAWLGSDVIEVEAHYRDSVWGDQHAELALHEYTLVATIDPTSNRLLSVAVAPRVLPFPECPSASEHATDLVGMAVEAFRGSVDQSLRGLDCCTHLNDMLRGLAEVPAMVRAL
jgi:hypothetical protein